MSHEDKSVPLVLETLGIELLPDGRRTLLVHCTTILDYELLPREFNIAGQRLPKTGWDSENHVAHFTELPDLSGSCQDTDLTSTISDPDKRDSDRSAAS